MRRSGLSAIRYPLMHRDVRMARNAWMRASGHPPLSYWFCIALRAIRE
jgi:hypothetical protein